MFIIPPKAGYQFIIILLSLVFLNSCSFSAKTSKNLLDSARNKGYDVIVVPGVPFEGEAWSETMENRVNWSVFLHRRGIAKNIIYTGGAVYSPYVEAEIMSLYAKKMGIPKENIFLETKAEHSTENIYYSYQLAKQLGFERVALASDRFQSKLLKKYVRKRVSPDVGIIPIVADSLDKFEKTLDVPTIDHQKAKVDNFVSIKERENLWKRLRGTRGKNIDYRK